MNDFYITFWFFGFWICSATKQNLQEYFDSEEISPEYFHLTDRKPLKLNETYCLEEISAATISSNFFGNFNRSLFYIKIMWNSKYLMTSIKLESDSFNDSYCKARNKHYYIRKPMNQTVHVFPDDVNEGIRFFPIKLDCKYIITPELEGFCRSFKLLYSTPVCIENVICSCRNIIFPGPVLEAEIDENGVTVTWSFPNNSETSVSHIVFSLFSEEDGINVQKLTKRKIALEEFHLAKGIKHKQYLQVNVTTGNIYRLQGYFEKNATCRGNSTFLLLKHPKKSEKFENMMSYTVLFVFLFLFFLTCFLIVWKSKLKKICLKLCHSRSADSDDVQSYPNTNSKNFLLPKMTSNPTYMECGPTCINQSRNSYLCNYEDIVILKKIASGNFGIVHLACSATGLKGHNEFAIKQLKDEPNPQELSDFLEEIEIFRQVGHHSNVVKMLGYCLPPQPITIIMEYVPFNLLVYLKNLRPEFEKKKSEQEDSQITYAKLSHSRRSSLSDYNYISENDIESCPVNNQNQLKNTKPTYVLDNKELEIFALQIAQGMAHLESKNIVHRDLAARNILMDYSKVLKISDFGMSKTGIYVNKKTRKFPLRWMSPEALVDRVYSHKSDVWSFGVVLWEIGTLGAFPYSSLQNEEVISLLRKGGHLDKPEHVTIHFYDLMMDCWATDPEERPNFKNLVDRIESLSNNISGYVEFDNLKPNYTFPPMEEDIKQLPEKEKITGGDYIF